MRALGFCVSVEHARFMARVFQEAGTRLGCGVGDSPEDERAGALADLAAGASMLSSPSTSSMKASICRPSTRCCCFAPRIARRFSCNNLGAGLRRLWERRSARCSTSSGIIARSSGSIDDFGRSSGAVAPISSVRSCWLSVFARRVSPGARPRCAGHRPSQHPRGDPDRDWRERQQSSRSLGDVSLARVPGAHGSRARRHLRREPQLDRVATICWPFHGTSR